MPDSWQAAAARHHFSDIVDAAVEGRPQFVRRRDGHEVVVVSKEYFEKTRPNRQSYLLTAGYADDDDEFDRILQDIRASGDTVFGPRGLPEETPRNVGPRHRRSK